MQKHNLSHIVLTQRMLEFGVLLFFIGMPLGTTMQGIGAALILFSVFFNAQRRSNLLALSSSNWTKAIAIFLLFCFCSAAWTQGSYADWLYSMKKYLKLLLLPVLTVAMMSPRNRDIAWGSFGLGIVLIILLLLANHLGLTRIGGGAEGAVFRNYIMNGHMLAFMAFAALLFAHQELQPLAYRTGAVVLCFFCILSLLCLNQGRTGYVAFFLMMGLYALFTMPNRFRYIGLFFSVCVGLGLVIFVPKIYQGFHSIYQHLYDFRHGSPNTSEGFRLQFQYYALTLWLKHPFLGNGLGSFCGLFVQDNPVPAWTEGLREPHSQYFLILAELGIVGFGALLLVFVMLFQTLLANPTTRWLSLALLLLFAAGNLSDSLLFYSGSGYFFLGFWGVLLGICYGSDSAKLSIRRTPST